MIIQGVDSSDPDGIVLPVKVTSTGAVVTSQDTALTVAQPIVTRQSAHNGGVPFARSYWWTFTAAGAQDINYFTVPANQYWEVCAYSIQYQGAVINNLRVIVSIGGIVYHFKDWPAGSIVNLRIYEEPNIRLFLNPGNVIAMHFDNAAIGNISMLMLRGILYGP